MSDTNAGSGLHVPARFIPTPKTVSPQAQTALAQPNPYGDGESEPDPADRAAWEKRSRELNEAFTSMLAARCASEQPASLMQHKLSHATLYEIEPKGASDQHAAQAVLYAHGGGFTLGGGVGAAYAAFEFAKLAGVRTFSIDYRMPPQSPFPAGLEDAVEAYRFVLQQYGASNIAVYGPSAGGALAASCLLKARDLKLPMPAACALHFLKRISPSQGTASRPTSASIRC